MFEQWQDNDHYHQHHKRQRYNDTADDDDPGHHDFGNDNSGNHAENDSGASTYGSPRPAKRCLLRQLHGRPGSRGDSAASWRSRLLVVPGP